MIGPSIPAYLKESQNEQELTESQQKPAEKKTTFEKIDIVEQQSLVNYGVTIGPRIGPTFDEEEISDDNDTYGPVLPTQEELELIEEEEKIKALNAANQTYDDHQREWEDARSGIDSNTQSSQLERDEWMIKLPSGSSSFDLGVMQRNVTHFSRRGVSDRGDTSGWTDDPEEKRRKALGLTAKTTLQMAKDMAMQRVMRDKNLELQKAVQQFNAEHRSESLLSIHLNKGKEPPPKELEKEKEKEKGKEKEKEKEKPQENTTKKSDSKESSNSSDSESSSSEEKKKRKKKDKKSKKKSKEKKRKSKKKSKDKKRKREHSGKPKESKIKEEEERKSPPVDIPKSEYVPYWDRDRDLVQKRIDPKKRMDLITQSTTLHSRFGGSSYL